MTDNTTDREIRALRRISQAHDDLRDIENRARKQLTMDDRALDAEYIMVAVGQVVEDLSDWLATVGDEISKEIPMTDTTTPMSMLEEHELFTIEKMLDEYSDADNTIPKIAWVRLLSDYRTLQTRVTELEAQNEEYRQALEFYAAHGGERARAALGMEVA